MLMTRQALNTFVDFIGCSLRYLFRRARQTNAGAQVFESVYSLFTKLSQVRRKVLRTQWHKAH